MKKSLKMFIAIIFFISIFFQPSYLICYATSGNEFSVTAKSAILIDADSEKIVFEKNSKDKLPIASMTKIASLGVIFNAIDKGVIKENDIVKVSENAASIGGSSAFLDAGSSYKVTDLIKTIIIASANDSCVALAEFLAGTEDVFVSRMNKYVQALGLTDTNFVNSTGLPIDNHYSTAYDMAKIYKSMCSNSIYKKYSKIWMEDFIHPSGRKTGLVNTNRLIKTFDGIDGGKTGYTDSAKFCLTASATRGTTRFIGVIIGSGDSKTRFAEMSNMLNFGFANFESKLLVNSEIPVTVLSIKRVDKSIDVYPERNSQLFCEKGSDENYSFDFKLNEINLPLSSGDVVGKMFVFDKNNMVVDEINLIVKTDVEKEKIKNIIEKLIENW